MSRAAAIVVVMLLVVAGGCALPEDDQPRVLTADMIPLDLNPTGNGAAAAGTQTALLYLVDSSSSPPALTVVERSVPSNTLRAALDALLAGPTDEEAARNIQSSIPAETTVLDVDVVDGIATIDLGGEEGGINSVQGTILLTAYAQIVLTAVAVEGVDAVLFLIDGAPVEVPNDLGSTNDPVDQFDYNNAFELPTAPTTTVRSRPADDDFGFAG